MKKLYILLMIMYASLAQTSQYTVTSLNNYDYVSGPNGYYGRGYTLGNTYYYNDNIQTKPPVSVMFIGY